MKWALKPSMGDTESSAWLDGDEISRKKLIGDVLSNHVGCHSINAQNRRSQVKWVKWHRCFSMAIISELSGTTGRLTEEEPWKFRLLRHDSTCRQPFKWPRNSIAWSLWAHQWCRRMVSQVMSLGVFPHVGAGFILFFFLAVERRSFNIV